MAKNFSSIYGGGNPASALNQSFFVKKETTRGTLVAPVGADFLFSLGGGSVQFSQPMESSPHRSGRHNNNIIKQKTATEWSLSTFFNIDVDAAYGACMDTAMKVLHESLLGYQNDSGTAIEFTPLQDPSTTFTIFENLDFMGKQAAGCYVESGQFQFPGDGQAQVNWSGRGVTVYHAGIAKSVTDNDAGNLITVAAGEEARFDVGAMVMLIESDGITRSADTPDGSPRKVVAIDSVAHTVEVDGVVLADADGSVTPLYLCYYEPGTPAGIDQPQTGLEGSVSFDTIPGLSCVRSAEINVTNNHEPEDYCFGKPGLGANAFIPAGRLQVECTFELNADIYMTEFLAKLRAFDPHAIVLNLGNTSQRYYKVTIPRFIAEVPAVEVPDTGSVPVTVTGMAFQTTLGAADELKLSYQ